MVLATKFRFRMWDGPNGTGASRHHIVRAVEDSLRRLKTDRIDLYQIHMQDIETPEEETLRALDDLVRAGKVLYLGCSNYAAYRLIDSLWLSKSLGLERFVTLQAQYTLVVRELEREHVPVCEKFGLGILPWSPLASGFLTGKYRKDAPPPAGARLHKWKEWLSQFDKPRNWRTLEVLDAVAKELGTTPSAVALRWLVQKPAVTSVIFGVRTPAQLDDNLKAAELKLPRRGDEEARRGQRVRARLSVRLHEAGAGALVGPPMGGRAKRVWLAAGDGAVVEEALAAAQVGEVALLDGAEARDKASFMAALARALRFPDHFGANWDAVVDCLGELEARREPTFLVIAHGAELLADAPAELEQFLSVIGELAALKVVLAAAVADAPVIARAGRLGFILEKL